MKPDAFTFSPDAPRIFFLLHGSTPPPERGKPAQPGTLAFARDYFSFSFVQELMGAGGMLVTRGGKALTASNWEREATADTLDNQTLYVPNGDRNRVFVLVPYDGSQHLVKQVRDVLSFVTDALAALNLPSAGCAFLAHSMGGLVMRTLLTAPSESIDGLALTARELAKAKTIQERALYLVTLATPHEGSPVADLSTEIRDVVRKLPTNLVGLPRIDLSELTGGLIGNANQYQLKSALWRTLNRGAIAPEKLARPDGTLIPLFALSGRTPGGPYYTDPDKWPLGGPKLPPSKEDGQMLGLAIVDWALHAITRGPDAWAKIPRGAEDMDTTARYARTNGGITLSKPNPIPFDPPHEVAFPIYYVLKKSKDRETSDRGADADGLVPIPSGLGMTLGGNELKPCDHRSIVRVNGANVRGSWYRLMSGPWDGANHVAIYRMGEVGEWLWKNVLKSSGPYPSLQSVGRWPREVAD